MRRKSLAVLAALAALSMFVAGPASAEDVAITAVVDSTTGGTRTITAAPASVTMGLVSGSANLKGVLTVTVTELLVPGVNPWSVTAKLAGNFVSGTNSIASSNFKLTPTTKVMAQTDTTIAMSLGAADQPLTHTLTTGATLFSVSNELTTAAYTGTYTGTGDLILTVPSGSKTGTYTATLTVTLVQ